MTGSHTLLFLEPGHFHAALTVSAPHPRLADTIVVYAPDDQERRDFLALVERFNRRATAPTRWRPRVITSADPLPRLVADRRGDVVVLAGRTAGKARTIRRLHEAGFHVLADKPWLAGPGDLEHVRACLSGWPLAMEMMTGRHDAAARLLKRLVDTRDVFGGFRTDTAAIEAESVHHLAKLVDGAPLRRPWWFFDAREQGSGVVDIPTHLVDQTQWLLEGTGVAPGEVPALLRATVWPTRVPAATFSTITGQPGFPPPLECFVAGGALDYPGNAELEYRIGGVTARAVTRWEVARPPGGADTYRVVARGTRADVHLEQTPGTGHRRRLVVETADEGAARALTERLAAWQAEWPGLRAERVAPGQLEVLVPAAQAGHESHFARVLAELLDAIDDRRPPTVLAARTLAKYTLLAEAAAVAGAVCSPGAST